MSDLRIEIVARDELGSIVALITPHGVVDARTASAEIARGDTRYVTGPDSYVRVPVHAISATGGAYLYANWDGSQRNNLHDLAPQVRVLRLRTPAVDPESLGFRERGAISWARLVQSIRMRFQRPPACVDCSPGA
jgi:hypothetical protein